MKVQNALSNIMEYSITTQKIGRKENNPLSSREDNWIICVIMDLVFSVNTHQSQDCIPSAYAELKERMRYIGKSGYHSIRINLKTFNKRDCEKIKLLLSAIQDVQNSFPKPVEVYLDIPFPYQKYRLNIKEKRLEVQEGDVLEIYGVNRDDLYNDHIFWIDREFFRELVAGNKIIYADGEGSFTILDITSRSVVLQADNCFTAYTNKSLYGGNLQQQAVTEQFSEFMRALYEWDFIKYILFSFCNTGAIKKDFDSMVTELPKKKCLAKIETIDGFNQMDSILDYFDGVVVARGDLAITCGISQFYNLHNSIAQKTKQREKQLFFATDILLSLLQNSYPNRADIIDFSNMMQYQPDGIILKTDFAFYKKIPLLRKYVHQFLELK